MRLFTLTVGSNPPTITPLFSIVGGSGATVSYGQGTFTRLVMTLQTLTYSTSITIDLTLGDEAVVTVTNGTAFAMNAPTGTPVTGELLLVTIRNTSGGAVGTITWNAVFKMAAFTTPATANSRSILFRYSGTNWVEMFKTPADVPN